MYLKFLVIFSLSLYFLPNLIGQNIAITDTVKPNPLYANTKSNSSFIVEGEVSGMDSGSIKIYSPNKGLSTYVPFRQGKFYFSGFVNTVEMIHFEINGDYIDNVFYLEPGQIEIKYIYQSKFTASGTIENNLYNFFKDTLNKKNTDRFWEVSNKMEIALKDEDLGLYLKLIDSFTIVEKNFFKTVNDAIAQKKYGNYLLSCVNYYYINYAYFAERKAIYDQLPENIRNSASGQQALEFLAETQKKNAVNIDEPAYQFTLKDVNNKPFALKNFEGKIIVLDFWASWCLPCIKALPLLKQIQKNDVSKNVVFISVSIDRNEKAWKEKEKKIGIMWHSLLADESAIQNYKVDAVPSYIVINKEGKIASKSSSLGNLYTTLKSIKK